MNLSTKHLKFTTKEELQFCEALNFHPGDIIITSSMTSIWDKMIVDGSEKFSCWVMEREMMLVICCVHQPNHVNLMVMLVPSGIIGWL